LNNRNWRACK